MFCFGFITFIVLLKLEAFVVTKYEPDILAEYFNHLHRYFHGDTPSNPFQSQNLTQYCRQLRNSRVFRSIKRADHPNNPNSNNNNNNNTTASNSYNVSNETLEWEEKQTNLRPKKFRIDESSETVHMTTFQCLDYDGVLRWYLTPSFIMDSAFLFNLEPSFGYTSSREVGVDRDMHTQLTAIIDESATVLSNTDMTAAKNRFLHSLIMRDSISNDPLCDLNRILQFRLCVVALDGMLKSMRNWLIQDEAEIRRYSSYQAENYLYEKDTSEENCPSVPIGELNDTRKLLSCGVYLAENNVTYAFYLSRNPLIDSNMFMVHIIPFFPIHRSISIVQELDVPLLKHSDEYKEALRRARV